MSIRTLVIPSRSTLTALTVLTVQCTADAVPWVEVGDAGDLPGTAQATQGSLLTSIIGTLTAGATNPDLYLISISPASFSAATVGGAGFDTQLFLFTLSGQGIAANDNSGGSLQSSLTGSLLSSLPAGPYIIGISGSNNEPLSAGGAIFPDLMTGVLGPTGPGGGLPLSGWSGDGATGVYTLTLTGAAGFPAPPSLGLLALAALTGRRRRLL